MFRTLATATTLGPNELLTGVATLGPPTSGVRERYGVADFFRDVDRDQTIRRRLDDSRNMLSDEDLMEGYKAGDRAAFAEIFRRYAPLLLRVMQQQLDRREDANDLVQQTFLQLHRSK